MKIKYLNYREPEWIRIPLSDVEIGEVFKDLKFNSPYQDGWWKDLWRRDKNHLTPLNRKWSGYGYPSAYFNKATVLVER